MRKSSTNSSLDVSSVVCVFTLDLVFLELDTHCAVSESMFFFFIHQEIEVLLRIHHDFFVILTS